MANYKVTDLTSYTNPDAANDVLEIVDIANNQNKSITRNNLLGLASAPVGLTDSQTLTNKVLTAPTLASPILSGTITGTYTLAGTPTFPAAVVTLTGSQTLTNKILTSPTISAPTITNASLTADAITGFSSANTGTIYGVAVTGATIGSAAIASAAITSSKLNLDFVENTLAGSFTSAASNTWQDTGLNVTLPTAGTWLVMADIRCSLSTTISDFAAFRYFNTTTSTAITNSERIVGQLQTSSASGRFTAPLTMRIATGANNTVIRIDIQPGQARACIVESDPNGRTHLMAFRIG